MTTAITDLETQRLENLRQKQELLAQLNLNASPYSRLRNKFNKDGELHGKVEGVEAQNSRPRQTPKKRKLPGSSVVPSRSSARIASAGARPSYNEDGGSRFREVGDAESTSRQIKSRRSVAKRNSTHRKPVQSRSLSPDGLTSAETNNVSPDADVKTLMESWSSWTPSEPAPTRSDTTAKFHFKSHPVFTPNLSPEEVIRQGAFGGTYFRPLYSRHLKATVSDDHLELPSSWTRHLDTVRYLTSSDYDPAINKFGVACGLSIEEWEANGWINHDYDVRGWFQWYVRFWLGRRCEDDERQIGRWARCVGVRGRWRRLLLKKYVAMGIKSVEEHDMDLEDEDDAKGTTSRNKRGEGKEVSPVMHQTCHHWAFEVRQADLDEAWDEFG